jgi:alkylated DNA nucleotide flippase Atl1
MNDDKIKKIPAGLEKYLGVGEMVLPSAITIKGELKKIPKDRLMTIPRLRANIAEHLGVTTACPKTTLAVLRKLMEDPSSSAYKMINGKGELVSKDADFQAELLKEDGFVVDDSKAKLKIKDYKAYLFQ